jgi:carbon-monoxide dehydrogenase medium subunit
MKPAPFGYHDPSSIADAVRLLAQFENARPLAGGQSLVPMMNFRYATPDHLIDLNGIAELSAISVGNKITLGAMTRQRDVEFSSDIRSACPILHEALLNIGHRQTRNRGTIGGSLCNLDPSAEIPAMMMLHDAQLTAQSIRGARDIAMADFALGFMTTALEPDEMLVRVSFDVWARPHGYGFCEYARRHGDYAIASAGVLIAPDARGCVARMAIVIGGLGPVPQRLAAFEAASVGATIDEALIAELVQAASSLEAMDDAHVSGDYRRHLAGVLVRRAAKSAIARLKASAHA